MCVIIQLHYNCDKENEMNHLSMSHIRDGLIGFKYLYSTNCWGSGTKDFILGDFTTKYKRCMLFASDSFEALVNRNSVVRLVTANPVEIKGAWWGEITLPMVDGKAYTFVFKDSSRDTIREIYIAVNKYFENERDDLED